MCTLMHEYLCMCFQRDTTSCVFVSFNCLNAKLNPICHLVALVGACHILHVSGATVSIIHRNVNKWIGIVPSTVSIVGR
jgi:hypothetical protein